MGSLISTQDSTIPPHPPEPSGLDFKAGDIGFNKRSDSLKAELLSIQNDYAIFETQVFIDGIRQVGSKYPDKSESRHELHADIPKLGQAVIVEVSSLRSKRFTAPGRLDSLSTSSSVLDYFGISGESLNATAAVWSSLQGDRGDSEEILEISAIARCVERIMRKSSVPEYPALRTKVDDTTDGRHSPPDRSLASAATAVLEADTWYKSIECTQRPIAIH